MGSSPYETAFGQPPYEIVFHGAVGSVYKEDVEELLVNVGRNEQSSCVGRGQVIMLHCDRQTEQRVL